MCKASCLFCKTKEIKPDPIFCLFWTFLKPWWFRDSVYEKKLEKSEKKLFTFFGIVFVDVQLSSSLLWVRFSSHWMIWNNYIQMTDHRLNFSSVMTKNIYVYIYIFQKKSDDQSILYTLAYRPYCSVQYRDTNFNSIYIKYVINQLHNFDKTCGTKYIIKWITFFFNFSLLLNYKKETFTSPQGFFFFNLWPCLIITQLLNHFYSFLFIKSSDYKREGKKGNAFYHALIQSHSLLTCLPAWVVTEFCGHE